MTLNDVISEARKSVTVKRLEQEFERRPNEISVFRSLYELSGSEDEVLRRYAEREDELTGLQRWKGLVNEKAGYEARTAEAVKSNFEEVLGSYTGNAGAHLGGIMLRINPSFYEGENEELRTSHRNASENIGILDAAKNADYSRIDLIAKNIVDAEKTRITEAINKAATEGHIGIAYMANSLFRRESAGLHLEARRKLIENAETAVNRYIEIIQGNETQVFRRIYERADDNGKNALAVQLGEELAKREPAAGTA